MAADLDLLLQRHSQFTHSVGAVLIVFAAAAILLRGRPRWVPLALALTVAYASHPLLDWLAEDATPPRGITALWPLSREYFLSHADIFRGISRELWKPGAVRHDVVAVLREVAILAPLAVGAWWVRRSGSHVEQRIRQPLRPLDPTARRGESRHD